MVVFEIVMPVSLDEYHMRLVALADHDLLELCYEIGLGGILIEMPGCTCTSTEGPKSVGKEIHYIQMSSMYPERGGDFG